MPDSIKNVIFRLTAEVSGEDKAKELASGVRDVGEAAKEAQGKVDTFENTVKKGTAALKEGSSEGQKMAGAVEQVGKSAEAGQRSLKGVSETVDKASGSFRAFGSEGKKAAGAVEPVASAVEQVGEKTKQTTASMKELTEATKSTGGSPMAEGMKKSVDELAETLLRTASGGEEAYKRLDVAAGQHLAVLMQVVEAAQKTPEGREALSRPITPKQKESLDMLRAMKAVTDEEAKAIANAMRLGNALDAPAKSATSLRTQLMQAQMAIAQAAEASGGKITPELLEAAKAAGELRGKVEDVHALMDAFTPDSGLKTLGAVATNAAGAFTAIRGAMALMNIESEEVGKGLLKVQAALAVTQGLQGLFTGLQANLKRLRPMLLAAAAGAQTLAVAEGEATAGAVAQTGATTMMGAAFTVAKNAAVSLGRALFTTPWGIIIAGIAAIGVALYDMAKGGEDAKATAEELANALEDVQRRRSEAAARSKNQEALKAEEDALKAILRLEKQRSEIPSSYTEEQRAAANLRIDEQVRNIERVKAARIQRAELDEQRELAKAAAAEQKRLNDEIGSFYEKGNAVFTTQAERLGKVALEAKEAGLEMNAAERAAAENRAKVNKNLSKEELEDLDALEAKRDEARNRERKALDEIEAIKSRGRTDQLRYEADLEKLQQRRLDAERKAQQQSFASSTIAELREQQRKLADTLNNQLKIGSPEFFAVAEKYIEVTHSLTEAQAALTGKEMFAAGSIADLNQELVFLKDVLDKIGASSPEEFEKVAAAIREVEAEIKALNDRARPAEDDGTKERLAALAESQRHAEAMHQLDVKAAATKAKNEGKTQEEIQAITDEGHRQLLRMQIDYERQKLAIMQAGGEATETEVQAQMNRLAELQAELGLPPDTSTSGVDDGLRTMLNKVHDAGEQIADIAFTAWGAWSDAAEKNLAAAITEQERRVAEAQKIADKGNATMLEAERDRLGKLEDQQRRAAERSAAIAQAEAGVKAMLAIVNIIASSSALGPGMVALGIGTVLAGLTAGILSAQNAVASAPMPQFYTGGPAEWSSMGGYTGDGHARSESNKLGKKPYIYHRREYVMDHATTAVPGNLAWFERIHKGRLSMNELLSKRAMVILQQGGMSDEQVDRIVEAIANQPRTSVRVDEDGLTIAMARRLKRRDELASLR